MLTVLRSGCQIFPMTRSYAWVGDGVVKQDERGINGIQEQGYSRDLRRV